MPPRIVSWNVNAIKTVSSYDPFTGKPWSKIAELLDCDVLCVQEVKAKKESLPDDMLQMPGWTCYYSLPKSRHGYSGVATFVKDSWLPIGTIIS